MTSTGSSFAGVAISQWQGQFNELDGGNINFNVSSSVIGMNDFCQATVDFGATDIAYSTGQSVCTTNQVPYPFQYMPTVAGGLAFEYNVTGQNGQQVTNLVLESVHPARHLHGGYHQLERPRHRRPQSRPPTTQRSDHRLLPRRPVR